MSEIKNKQSNICVSNGVEVLRFGPHSFAEHFREFHSHQPPPPTPSSPDASIQSESQCTVVSARDGFLGSLYLDTERRNYTKERDIRFGMPWCRFHISFTPIRET